MATSSCTRRAVSTIFEYNTPKVVHIQSRAIGITSRIIQGVILGYTIISVFITHRGYQLTERGLTGVTTQVTGVAFSESETRSINSPHYRVWDSVDVAVPAEEYKAFFVSTNLVVTNNQTQSVCAEDVDIEAAHCVNDIDCQPLHKPYMLGNGVSNGTCNNATGTCFVAAWCPLENDNITDPNNHQLIEGTKDFTVLIKNHVYFPRFNASRSNIEDTDKSSLDKCRYDREKAPLCPVFTLEYMVNEALKKLSKPSTYKEVISRGAVIAIRIFWDCDLDRNVKDCRPDYKFDRLDLGSDGVTPQGYNYRYAHRYVDKGISYRQRIKAFGVLFKFTIDASGGKFDIIPTLQNIGACLALLTAASIVCDLVLLYCHSQRRFFKAHKYEDLGTGSDDATRGRQLEDIDDPYSGLNGDL